MEWSSLVPRLSCGWTGMNTVVYCPPSACVSPSDRTLTMENVREVMAEVGDWEKVRWLVHDSKQQEIKQQSSTEREKSLALGDYWVNTNPNASWERLATELYEEREERALAVTKQYLQQQQGMCTSCLTS